METRHVALILVDIQRDFWPPFKERFPDLPGNVIALLEAARERGHPVIHVRSSFKPDRSDWMLFYKPEGRGDVPCIAGTEGEALEDFVVPLPGEPVVIKQVFDSFVSTDLAGLETSVCVLFTANSAYMRRMVPLVVSDACGDEPERHDAVLKMYGDLSFKVVTTDQFVNKWDSVSSLVDQFAE
jgi:nicotinamidase-related amidase